MSRVSGFGGLVLVRGRDGGYVVVDGFLDKLEED